MRDPGPARLPHWPGRGASGTVASMTVATHYPGVTYGDPPKGTSGALSPVPPRLIVIHATDNATATARNEAHYAATRTDPQSRWTSAHFYVDDNEVIGSQSLLMRAWGCYSGNALSWQIEICGKSGALSTAATNRAADFVRGLCAYGKIPTVKLSPDEVASGAHGICGHADITLAFPADKGTHTDPGWGAQQWSSLIARIRGADVEQNEKLLVPTANNKDRMVGNVLTDLDNLRDWWIGAGAAVPGDASWPRPDSPAGRLAVFLANPGAFAGGLTDVDRALIGSLRDELHALNATVTKLSS